MADDAVYADLLPALSPLDDPDGARLDRKAAMAKLLGADGSAPASAPWYQQPEEDEEPQQQQATPQQVSQNGNPLPDGLQSRQPQPAAPAQSATPPPAPGEPRALPGQGRQSFEPAPGVKPTVPGSVTPDGSPTTPNLKDMNTDTLATQAAVYKSAADQTQRLNSEPDIDTLLAPDRAKLAQDTARANASPYVPGSSKLLPNYRPSLGQRIVRGVDGFARRGIFGVVDPTIGGGDAYGAPNNLYRGQVAQAQKDAGADKATIADKLASWKERQNGIRANAKDLGALATTGKDVASANQAQQDQTNRDAEAAARTAEAYNASPEGKAEAAKELNEQTITSREAQLKDPKNPVSKSSAADKAYFMGTGKMPDPDRYHTPPEQLRYNQALAADEAAHPQGWKPSVEDIRGYAAAAKGEEVKNEHSEQDDDDASAIVADSVGKKEKWAAQFDRNPKDGTYTNRGTEAVITGQQYDDAIDQFRKDANVKLARKGYVMDETGTVVPLRKPKPSAPAPAAAIPGPTAPGAVVKPTEAAPVMPPASLLESTPEGGTVYGKRGEAFTKRGGKWVQQK